MSERWARAHRPPVAAGIPVGRCANVSGRRIDRRWRRGRDSNPREAFQPLPPFQGGALSRYATPPCVPTRVDSNHRLSRTTPGASAQQMLARSALPWLGTAGQGLRCRLEVMTPLLLRSRSLTSTRFPHRCASGSVVLIVIALRKMRGSNPRDVAVLPASNRLPYLSANLPEVGSPQPQVRFLGVPCNFRHSPQLPHQDSNLGPSG